MEISLIKTNGLLIKGKNCVLAIDPLNQKNELSVEEKNLNCILITNPLWDLENEVNLKDPELKLFCWPGEFEVKGVGIAAKPEYSEEKTDQRKLLYLISIDGFKLCYLPELTQELHSDLIEIIGDIDLLIMPMVKDQKTISNTLEEIEPKALLALNPSQDAFLQEEFIKKLGLTNVEEKTVIKIVHKSDLTSDKMGLFLLQSA